jgi:hypothetical protein
MCCCGKPTINGEPGCKMTYESAPGIHPLNPPALEERDVLLFDEPGRCGGTDSHAFHYRLVEHCGISLLVRHGGGDERLSLSTTPAMLQTLTALDSNARYWIFNAIFHAHHDAARDARIVEADTWRTAAAEKRIKTRKFPSRGIIKVWIDPARAA